MVETGCSSVDAVALRWTLVGELELEPVKVDMAGVWGRSVGGRNQCTMHARRKEVASHTCDAWLVGGQSARDLPPVSGSELLARWRYARRACQLGPALR